MPEDMFFRRGYETGLGNLRFALQRMETETKLLRTLQTQQDWTGEKSLPSPSDPDISISATFERLSGWLQKVTSRFAPCRLGQIKYGMNTGQSRWLECDRAGGGCDGAGRETAPR